MLLMNKLRFVVKIILFLIEMTTQYKASKPKDVLMKIVKLSTMAKMLGISMFFPYLLTGIITK